MIKRQYVVDCEVMQAHRKWSTISFELTSWFPVEAGKFSKYVRDEVADYHNCDAGDVRIIGVFKL
jgi:hypothetical protein